MFDPASGRRHFASDNYSGVCPEAWDAMARANQGHVPAYGDEVATALRSRGWRFYTFIGAGGARFMCSWDTAESDVTALINDIRELMAAK